MQNHALDILPASLSSLLGFVVILAAVIVSMLAAVHFSYRNSNRTPGVMTLITTAILVLWLGVYSLVVANGAIFQLPWHGLPIVLGSTILICLVLSFSPIATRIAHCQSLSALVTFQAFRLPLELVLHSWAVQGVIPATMTWTGQNWDIISGAVCLLAAPLANKRIAVAWFANIIGCVLLLNVLRVVVLSSPLPFAWGQEPSLLLVFHLPYSLILPVCVGGAIIGHIVLTRALLEKIQH